MARKRNNFSLLKGILTESTNTGKRGFTGKMQKKLAVLFIMVLLIFVLLGVRIYAISRDHGDTYKRQVLSQQEYDSVVLPAKRGEIVDRNGTKIAVSQKVYNVCIDAKTLNSKDGQYLEPTLTALFSTPIQFRYSQQEIRNYIAENPGSQYRVVARKQSYDAVSALMDALNNSADYPDLKGVWLEETFQRHYPYNSLACDVIGFVQGDNEGAYGLEEHYNSLLSGTDGRSYGYLNDDENLERTVKAAEDGRTLVTSIDVNIQSIVEKHILAFNKEHENEARDGYGSNNTGVIIMKPNTGEVLAMASYPVFDLNNPRDDSLIKVEMPDLESDEEEQKDSETSEADEESSESAAKENEEPSEASEENALAEGEDNESSGLNITESRNDVINNGQSYEEAYEEAKMEAFNALWKNFCVANTYEPGSTMKPFSMAMGLEEGILSGNESYVCNGYLTVGDHDIHCSNRLGHGPLTFSGALEQSCNVAFMKIGSTIGRETFLKYSEIFNFGLKTNVDLTGESRTDTLVFDKTYMTPTDLAIGSFGQGFNVTMIQMITGYCSLINGGKYIQPHFVTEIRDSNGATIEKIDPRVLKQTVSEETSAKIRELCNNVVSEGTGKSARPAGYRIGGKTGTAETLPRGNGEYVVSFIGFAPADNPEIAIYTVIDRPNVYAQASAKYATVLTREILTEVLPYLNVPKTEELSEAEQAELLEKQIDFAKSSDEPEEAEEAEGEEETQEGQEQTSTIEIVDENGNPVNTETVEEEYVKPNFDIDPATGYAIDPSTGALIDPVTGELKDSNVSDLPD